MNSIKILHTADIHIGAAHSYLGDNSEKRRYETLVTFENIIDLAVENKVDIIALAGDIFDTDSPESTFVDAVFNKIASASQIKVIYAAGNHDPLNSNSPFKTKALPENLYVLPSQDSQIIFEDIKTRIYGRSFETAHLKGEETFSLEVPNDDYINIMVQHGELRSDLNSDYNAITPAFVKKSGMDYIALGHVHKHTPIGKIDNVSFAYCGCPEGQGFDELDDKGVYLGTVSKGKCDLEFISVSKRKHIHEKVDLSGVSDIASHVLSLLQNKYENFSQNLYKIEFTGQIPEDTNLNLAELTARLSNQLYFVKLKDATEFIIDYESLAKETSLKGVFVKNMLEKIDQDPENETVKKALKLGLKAFSSEVKYNED